MTGCQGWCIQYANCHEENTHIFLVMRFGEIMYQTPVTITDRMAAYDDACAWLRQKLADE